MTLKSKFRSKPVVLAAVVGVFAAVIAVLYATKPQPQRRFGVEEPKILVETRTLRPQRLDPVIESYGIVEPYVQSQVVAQVGGRVQFVAETFRDGGFFEQGEVLLRIDDADYRIEVDIARAALAEAKRNLQEQLALAEQARVDWQRLGGDREASALTLREPQVAAAQASVDSARASVEKAELNLARTEIRAPYDGRVLSKAVDLGQVINPNTALGEIYATDAVEIRLPIKNSDLKLLDLPEQYRNGEQRQQAMPDVAIVSQLSGTEVWQGKIVRTASALDENSRQLYVVARIEDPFGSKAQGRFPLKIGQYVTAKIRGTPLHDVLTVPVRTVYQGNYVYVYREGAVYRQPIDIAWQDSDLAIPTSGLKAGDQLVLSTLGQVASGTAVKIKPPGSDTAEAELSPPANTGDTDPPVDDGKPESAS